MLIFNLIIFHLQFFRSINYVDRLIVYWVIIAYYANGYIIQFEYLSFWLLNLYHSFSDHEVSEHSSYFILLPESIYLSCRCHFAYLSFIIPYSSFGFIVILVSLIILILFDESFLQIKLIYFHFTQRNWLIFQVHFKSIWDFILILILNLLAIYISFSNLEEFYYCICESLYLYFWFLFPVIDTFLCLSSLKIHLTLRISPFLIYSHQSAIAHPAKARFATGAEPQFLLSI